MRKGVVAAMILACLCGTAYAEDAFSITGPGMATCGQFGEEYTRDVQIEAFFFSWGQGWMSAANLLLSATAGKSSTTDLAVISVEEQMLHIRAYCEENPFKYYQAAVIDLYDSMRRTQGLPGWIASFKRQ